MKHIAFLALLFAASPAIADETTYRPGGATFANAWHQFYELGDHELELDDPLIRAGKRMVPAICEAVAHQDMKRRRYAIGALGYIRSAEALPCLGSILKDQGELDYFRGDALQSIYLIRPDLGRELARVYGGQAEYLRMISNLIERSAFPLSESGLDSE